MPRPITVTITSRQTGTWEISPFTYERNAGLQRYPDGTIVRYKVPLYVIKVEDARTFRAVRFGLVNRMESTPPPRRRCDAGLTQARSVRPGWRPDYSPHSFTLPGRPGAWPITGSFLIHQGSDGSTIGGSLGCIEIVGNGEWDAFLALLERTAGATCAQVGAAQSLTVNLEAADYPIATLVTL